MPCCTESRSQARHAPKGKNIAGSTRPRLYSPPACVTCVSLFLTLGLTPIPIHAQTAITGVYTGTPGAPGAGNDEGQGIYIGNNGGDGYFADAGTYVASSAACTGGAGGAVVGTPSSADQIYGGAGGSGVLLSGLSFSSLNATIDSGTFTGGEGGAVTGTATTFLIGGTGGDGLAVGGDSPLVVIDGGTFRGGDGGAETGSAQETGGGTGGAGLNVEGYNDLTVIINGGTFIGGNQGSAANNNVGFYQGALIATGGTTNVYGGTFTAGTAAFDFITNVGIDVDYSGMVTLYGTGFTVTDSNGTVTPDFTGAIPLGIGTITGTLQNNGVETTITYYNEAQSPGAGLFIASAPEPSQFVALGISILGLGALVLRARCRVRTDA